MILLVLIWRLHVADCRSIVLLVASTVTLSSRRAGSDTLPLTNGEKTIHRANPEIETVVDTGSRNRIGWISKEGHALIHDRKGLAV